MQSFSLRHFVALFLAAFAALPLSALGQGRGDAVNPLVEIRRGIIREYTARVDALEEEKYIARADALEKEIAANREQDGKLVEIRSQLDGLARELFASAVAFRPRLAEINARLEQLGPAPDEGQQELDIVSDERERLLAEKSEINAVLSVAESLSIRVNVLIDRIGAMRSELFRNVLTRRYALNEAFNDETLQNISDKYASFYRSVSSWLKFVIQYKFRSVLAAAFFALVAAAALRMGGRRISQHLIHADPAVESPSYLNRLSAAFWSTLLPTATVAVFLFATFFFLDYFNVLRGDIGTYIRSLFVVIGVVFCVHRLATAALSPSFPNWRLISINTRAARLLVLAVTAMAVVVGINSFLAVINSTLGSALSLTIVRSFLASVVVGLLLIMVGLLRYEADGWKPWHGWIRYTAIALGAFIIISALLGYIGLATFAAQQVVLTGSVLITAYIGFLAARAIGEEGGFAQTSIGRWLETNSSTDAATLDQLGLVVSLVIDFLILVGFLPLVLFMWGFQPSDILAWISKLSAGFTIGAFRFSPIGILTGIAVFIIGYFLTRWFQGWLDGQVMARGRLDTGVRNSVRTVVGYAGLALAALIAISSAGFDLSNFALIAGGLSLGIGFGLQNVVSNFVSGLILLAERPFKAGDWIVAGDVTGTVKKISVRATEIETFQRQSVILPNSQLINSAVGNWTHRNKFGRVEIPVRVAYGSDVRKVYELLLELARSHPLVLKNPEPSVFFAALGPSSLDFEVRVFLGDILNLITVQNDLRFAILEKFAEEGIEIPFPQSVVTVKPEDTSSSEVPANDISKANVETTAGKKTPVAKTTPKRRARKQDPT